MANPSAGPWLELIEDARRYPSPHNSQPIKVRILGPDAADVFYDLDLGLPAESYGIPFGHVCAGVFLESLSVVALGHGYRTVETLDHADLDFDAADRLHRLGGIRLEKLEQTPAEREVAEAGLATFRARQTSRRPYDSTLVESAVLARAAEIAAAAGYTFRCTAERSTVAELVQINQATLFSDLQNNAVYAEIMNWLRFSRREALDRGDGLSAETMLMPGPVLRFAMGNRRVWSLPVIGAIIRFVYLRTMRGVRELGWIEGPFASPADYVEAGRTFMRIWLYLTTQRVLLHPFGTVITNPGSHQRFVEALSIQEGDGRMAWMLFRFGRSATPPIAHRRPAAAMLVTDSETR